MSVDSILVASAPRSRLKVFALAAATTAGIIWFMLLGARPLFDPDEGRYAEIPREMLTGTGWIIPRLNGLVYLEKPPLQYWLTAGAMRLMGPSEFAARLVTGVAGLLTLLLVYAMARRLWGVRAARDAALSLCGASLFVLLSHQLTLDMLLTLWLTAALACFIRAQLAREDRVLNRRWMLACWAAMALAVLTKGLIGALIPAMTLIMYSLLQRDHRMYDCLNLRWGLPVFAAIAAPWFVAAARQNPAFLEFFFIREHLERYLTPIEHRVQPWWFFSAVMLLGLLPWAWRAARALALDGRRRLPAGQFDVVRLLWVWSVFILVFFSASDSKLIPYVLPAVPALALLCARRNPASEPGAVSVGVVLTLVAGVALAIALILAAHARQPPAALLAMEAFRMPLAWLALALGVAGSLAGRQLLHRRPARASMTLCVGWFLGISAVLSGSVAGDAQFNSRDTALLLRREIAPSDPVFAVGGYDQTIPFYLGRPVTLAAYRGEFDLGLSQEPWRGVQTLPDFSRRWESLPQAHAWVVDSAWDALTATQFEYRLLVRSGQWRLISRR